MNFLLMILTVMPAWVLLPSREPSDSLTYILLLASLAVVFYAEHQRINCRWTFLMASIVPATFELSKWYVGRPRIRPDDLLLGMLVCGAIGFLFDLMEKESRKMEEKSRKRNERHPEGMQ
jgi:hypothetical protein